MLDFYFFIVVIVHWLNNFQFSHTFLYPHQRSFISILVRFLTRPFPSTVSMIIFHNHFNHCWIYSTLSLLWHMCWLLWIINPGTQGNTCYFHYLKIYLKDVRQWKEGYDVEVANGAKWRQLVALQVIIVVHFTHPLA